MGTPKTHKNDRYGFHRISSENKPYTKSQSRRSFHDDPSQLGFNGQSPASSHIPAIRGHDKKQDDGNCHGYTRPTPKEKIIKRFFCHNIIQDSIHLIGWRIQTQPSFCAISLSFGGMQLFIKKSYPARTQIAASMESELSMIRSSSTSNFI